MFLFKTFSHIEWSLLLDYYTKHTYNTCLEIGSSTVWKTEQLSNYATNVIGLEIFPDRTPSNRTNILYVTGDWHNLNKYIEHKSIDVAIACHVIEHVNDDKHCIEQLYNVLNIGASAFLITPNRKRLSRRIIEIFKGPRVFPHWEHVREYDYDEINLLIANSRFEKSSVIPVAIGFHLPYINMYIHPVPTFLRRFAAVWLVRLEK